MALVCFGWSEASVSVNDCLNNATVSSLVITQLSCCDAILSGSFTSSYVMQETENTDGRKKALCRSAMRDWSCSDYREVLYNTHFIIMKTL